MWSRLRAPKRRVWLAVNGPKVGVYSVADDEKSSLVDVGDGEERVRRDGGRKRRIEQEDGGGLHAGSWREVHDYSSSACHAQWPYFNAQTIYFIFTSLIVSPFLFFLGSGAVFTTLQKFSLLAYQPEVEDKIGCQLSRMCHGRCLYNPVVQSAECIGWTP